MTQMLKFKFDTESLAGLDDIVDGLKERMKGVPGAIASDAEQHAHSVAAQKLGPSGLAKWNQGFKIKVHDDLFIISIEGKLANWMEDGIKVGEISESIMSGNRAKSNASQGKHYVDVPLTKNADQAGNISSSPKVNVAAFKDAHSMMKSINASDWKKGGIKQQKVIQSRVQDIIKNVSPKTGATSFMTIRRVTAESKWPSSPFPGAKVLEDLDSYIDQNLNSIIERFL